ncbi:hypothetical protein WICMUC_004357 [Wickerhamomyces mucosus]|uniref:Large ribosomal subunit protein bL21m n=1 Tax=Wickerhamomyces mucosus TaxID=1378264 RepID=A0A9P8PI56_9ASCO|nr:hypothetical protein WICMUC_004357 [Wickerhamomyces mucosus]
MHFFIRSLARIQLRNTSRVFTSPITNYSLLANRTFSISSTKYNQTITNTTQDSKILKQLPDLTPLKLEDDLYAVIKVHSNPFLVTEGDKVILPYNLKHAQVGDVLNFNDVAVIGSRNYTFTDDSIDPSLYTIKAVVLEKTKLPMRIREITKRRQRKVRHAISKPHRTILRITELKLK